MKRLLCFLAFAGFGLAQDVTGVQDFVELLVHPPTSAFSITASQGDGTVCNALKKAGSTIYLTLNCTSGKTLVKNTVLRTTDTVVSNMVWGYGDVLCIFVVNPTATAVPAAGSFPAIPAVSVGYQCSTNIRTAGAVTGQTPVISGSVSWP